MIEGHNQLKLIRYIWIDVLKGLAILAVLVDHHGLSFAKYCVYSVPVFFLILGFNSYNSISKNNDSSVLGRLISCTNFFVFYIISTTIYLIESGKFSFPELYKNIVFFSVSAPFYFCAIYLQLCLFSCITYKILIKIKQKNNLFFAKNWAAIYLILLVGFYFISLGMKKIVIFPDLHGGGKYLLGATYLFLMLAGMLISSKYKNLYEWKNLIFYMALGILCLSPFYINSIWANPPKFMTCIYAISIFLVVAFSPIIWGGLFSKIFSFIGKYSIHIFMYHILVMKYTSSFESKAISFLLAITIPILVGIVLDFIVLRKRLQFRI